MKKAIVFPNRIKDDQLRLTRQVIAKLHSLEIEVCLNSEFSDIGIAGVCFYENPPEDAELIVVIGGDGSVIDASRLALELGVPLLGINLGKVGYLATVDPDGIDSLCKLASGEYYVSERMLLAVEKTDINGNLIYSDRLAVNDVIVSHINSPGITDIRVESGRSDSVRFRSDGIVLATPTGSTAYSLSAGGPIVSPDLDSIVLTPICPHSFFDRSVVYCPDEVICVTNLSDKMLNISIDGRFFDTLSEGESCRVHRSDTKMKMLSLEDVNLFSTLSKKIKIMHELV